MIKKQKLSITTTSIRNLTGTELDTVAGGYPTAKCEPSWRAGCTQGDLCTVGGGSGGGGTTPVSQLCQTTLKKC